MKNWKMFKVFWVLVFLGFTLFLTACDPEIEYVDKPYPVNVYHGAIYAFGKVIAIEGDTSLSSADFKTAVNKLGVAFSWIDVETKGADNEDIPPRSDFHTMLGRSGFKIIIGTDNASPAKGASNLEMTIGVGYLLSPYNVSTYPSENDTEMVGNAIWDRVDAGDFKD